MPEVSLVVILDADKEGFLRSRSSLIQTMGRAARHENSEVILYADKITKSIEGAMEEVERRRKVQIAYNKKHGIIPKSIKKEVRKKLVDEDRVFREEQDKQKKGNIDLMLDLGKKGVLLPDEKRDVTKKLRKNMREAAQRLDFETAAIIRDQIKSLESR